MECLLCYFKSSDDCSSSKCRLLKEHYERFHKVDLNNFHFKNLFKKSDLNDRVCLSCRLTFLSNIKKKNHMFLRHYSQQQPKQQIAGSTTIHVNILYRGKITYFSINYDQHKDYYNFFNSDIVRKFLDAVYRSLSQRQVPNTNFLPFLNWLTNNRLTIIKDC